MNNVVIKENQIQNFIYEVRGIQVMLDSDLAKLYNCKNGTKEINQAVYRNKEKFPKRYTWKLDDNESINFLVTNCDQKTETRGGGYKNPRVFTEEGVAMLATILKSNVAAQVTMNIMDAFVLRNLKVKVLLITKNNNGLLNKLDIEKYNKQYNNLTIKYTNKFYD